MPKGITAGQVYEVCDRLAAEGKRPTIKLIREGLGGTGSATTICNHLQDWHKGNLKVISDNADLPSTITAGMLAWIEEKSAAKVQAKDEVIADLTEVNAQLKGEVDDKEEALASAQSEVERLRKELDLLGREKGKLEETLTAGLKEILPEVLRILQTAAAASAESSRSIVQGLADLKGEAAAIGGGQDRLLAAVGENHKALGLEVANVKGEAAAIQAALGKLPAVVEESRKALGQEIAGAVKAGTEALTEQHRKAWEQVDAIQKNLGKIPADLGADLATAMEKPLEGLVDRLQLKETEEVSILREHSRKYLKDTKARAVRKAKAKEQAANQVKQFAKLKQASLESLGITAQGEGGEV